MSIFCQTQTLSKQTCFIEKSEETIIVIWSKFPAAREGKVINFIIVKVNILLKILEYMWKSECAYVEALTIAQKRMLSTHPVRLHLVLSCAILYEDLLEEPEKAKNLAVTVYF